MVATVSLPGAATWAEPVALGLVIVVITYFSLVVGELTPKALALRDPDRIACAVARPVMWLRRLSSGVVRILTVSTRGVLRMLGLGLAQESPFISEHEVRYLVQQGAAKGIFDRAEEALVHNIFEFGDTTVREIMVLRPRILGLDVRTPPEDVLKKAVEIGRSRILVYSESIDRPVGVIVIRDLLRCAAFGQPPILAQLMHDPLFVPETARVSMVLGELQRSGQHLAVVVDEYGGVVGLMTIEDVLEEIVGDIREGREVADLPSVTKLPDGSYVMEGDGLRVGRTGKDRVAARGFPRVPDGGRVRPPRPANDPHARGVGARWRVPLERGGDGRLTHREDRGAARRRSIVTTAA